MEDFKERLQDLMTEKSLNKYNLSKVVGVASTTISGYFNKNYYPQINIAIKMANCFNCSLDYLFGLSEIRNNSDKNNNSFFSNFSKLMKGKVISKVFKELNMSDYNYYRWEAGLFPKTINIIDLAKYFDVSVDYLVGNGK